MNGMNYSVAPTCITVASGKGGVGKTSISVNLAFELSKIGKTLLIDADLQNQGMSHLLNEISETNLKTSIDRVTDLYNLLLGTKNQAIYTSFIETNLFFMPAISLASPPGVFQVYDAITSEERADRFRHIIRDLLANHGFDFVLIDCHGEIDLITSSAMYESNYTVVVTEADAVTFGGTLDLMRYYVDLNNRTKNSRESKSTDVANTTIEESRMTFVVNRIKGSLSFNSLRDLYQPYLNTMKDNVLPNGRALTFIPDSDLVKETFGDYPFFVKLLPESVFGRKIRTLAFDLAELRVERRGPDFDYGVISAEKRLKSRKIVKSEEATLRDRSISFIFASAAILLFYSLSAAVSVTWIVIDGPESQIYSLMTVVLTYSSLMLGLWFFSRTAWQVFRHYSYKYRFERKLISMSARDSGGSRWTKLIVLGAMKVGMLLVSAFSWVLLASAVAGIATILIQFDSLFVL